MLQRRSGLSGRWAADAGNIHLSGCGTVAASTDVPAHTWCIGHPMRHLPCLQAAHPQRFDAQILAGQLLRMTVEASSVPSHFVVSSSKRSHRDQHQDNLTGAHAVTRQTYAATAQTCSERCGTYPLVTGTDGQAIESC